VRPRADRGFFTAINGVSRNYVARLNADGSLDDFSERLAGADDVVFSVAVQPDGRVRRGLRRSTG
jgi:hypothetical protein